MNDLFSEISFINLYSSNNKGLIKFFRDQVGIKPQAGQDENQNWYGFQTKNVTLAVEPMANKDRHYPFKYNKDNPILIQFKARDRDHMNRMIQKLEENGVDILRKAEESSYGVITNFVDPDGNLYEILLEKEK